jgi:hypothetical protein
VTSRPFDWSRVFNTRFDSGEAYREYRKQYDKLLAAISGGSVSVDVLPVSNLASACECMCWYTGLTCEKKPATYVGIGYWGEHGYRARYCGFQTVDEFKRVL